MRQRYLRCWSVSASCGAAAVPLGGADEEVAGGRVRERGVDHDRLDVGAELERSVDLGLDVVLERAGEDGLREGVNQSLSSSGARTGSSTSATAMSVGSKTLSP